MCCDPYDMFGDCDTCDTDTRRENARDDDAITSWEIRHDLGEA